MVYSLDWHFLCEARKPEEQFIRSCTFLGKIQPAVIKHYIMIKHYENTPLRPSQEEIKIPRIDSFKKNVNGNNLIKPWFN